MTRSKDRLADILAMRRCGATLAEIGLEHGLTRERIRQICQGYKLNLVPALTNFVGTAAREPELKEQSQDYKAPTPARARLNLRDAELIRRRLAGEGFTSIARVLAIDVKTARGIWQRAERKIAVPQWQDHLFL